MSITQSEFCTNIAKYLILSQNEDIYVTLDNEVTVRIGKAGDSSKGLPLSQTEEGKQFMSTASERKEVWEEIEKIINESRINDVPQERNWI